MTHGMNWIDYSLVIAYLAAMLWLGLRFKQARHGNDYFLGGKSFGAFSLCMSTMATQLSAVSFVSAPAFVGLRSGGGMQWLTYEFGVPLAMIAIIGVVGPQLYRAGVISVYAYLEERLGTSSRMLVAALFMALRGVAAAITIYIVCIVLATITGFAYWQMMLVLGLVTTLYSLEGGMKAIVYSEVAQMIVKVLGILIILGAALYHLGGWSQFLEHLDRHRLNVIDLGNFGFDGREYGFWPMLFGGFFLYLGYYGSEQTQAQRILSARDEGTIRKLLLLNGLLRFPITFAYSFGGLVLGAFAASNADFAALIPAERPDLMIPMFIAHYLPHAVIGIIVISLLAAGMSAYSSALNSLSAVTMEDFLARYLNVSKQRYVALGKLVALAWGIATMALGLVADRLAKTAIEAINKMTSVFLGPILGMFLLAMLGRGVHPLAANVGAVCGVAVNLTLWLAYPQVFWFWWNAIGALTTLAVGMTLSFALRGKGAAPSLALPIERGNGRHEAAILAAYFIGIVVFCWVLPKLF
jgi:SSS family transporter